MNDAKTFIITGVVAIVLIAGIAFLATKLIQERGPTAADLPAVPPPPSFTPPDPNATTSEKGGVGIELDLESEGTATTS